MDPALAAAQAADELFGPQWLDRFDFTLKFENILMGILPHTLFTLFALVYVAAVYRKPVLARPGAVLWTKATFSISLVGLSVANLVVRSIVPAAGLGLGPPAAALNLVASILVAVFIYVQHTRSVHTISLFSVYLSLTFLFDMTQSRSFFIRQDTLSAGVLSALAAATRLVLVVLEEVPKQSLMLDITHRELSSKEVYTGFWTKCLASWFISIFIMGYRSILTIDNLPDLEPEIRARRLHEKFQAKWNASKTKSLTDLTLAGLGVIKWDIAITCIPRILNIAFSFTLPYLMSRILVAVDEEGLSSDTIAGLVGATFLVLAGKAISMAYYTYLKNRSMVCIRSIVVVAINDKSLRLPLATLSKVPSLTLTTTDTLRISMTLQIFHDAWSGLVSVGIGAFVLQTYIGVAASIIAPATIFLIAMNHVGSSGVVSNLQKWNESAADRVSHTSDALRNVRSIKMAGLTTTVVRKLEKFLDIEIAASMGFRLRNSFYLTSLAMSEPVTVTTVIAAAMFWGSNYDTFGISQILATYAALTLIQDPLWCLMGTPMLFKSCQACLGRVHDYLMLDEWQDPRMEPVADVDEKVGIVEYPIQLDNIRNVLVGDDKQVFQHLDLKFRRGDLNMIVGPVGCGKSTLLKLILGHVPITEGRLHVEKGSIAFCDQAAWLQDLTIRQNIVGQHDFSSTWYDEVIAACCLQSDLAMLSAGDNTRVGPNGCNLSGGQRHRVALARAVYSKRNILVLDNVFSSLDRNTCHSIFGNLFLDNGLLRKLNTTVIMATNLVEHLSHADLIVMLNSDGTAKQYKILDDSLQTDFLQRESDLNLEETRDTTVSENDPTDSKRDADVNLEDKDIETTRIIKNAGDISIFKFYASALGAVPLFLFLVSMFISSVIDKVPLIYLRVWKSEHPDEKLYVIGFALLPFISFLIYIGTYWYWYMIAVLRAIRKVHSALLVAVFDGTWATLTSSSSGSLLNRFSQDLNLISKELPGAMVHVISQFWLSLLDLGLIASGTSFAAAILPFVIAIFYFLQKFYLPTARQMRQLDLEGNAPIAEHITEVAAGIYTIRAFGTEGVFQEEGWRRMDRSQKPYYYMYSIQQFLMLVTELVVAFMGVFLVALALKARSFTSQGAIGLGILGLVTYSYNVTVFMSGYVRVETALGSVSRMKAFVETTEVEEDASLDDDREVKQANWPSSGEIVFSGVSASYSTDESKPKVLQDLSVKLQSGQKVAVLGKTGSGKSTTLLTLLRFIEYSGSITIDGEEVNKLPRHLIRSRITTIPQDTYELAGSVRENLQPSQEDGYAEASDELMIDTLTRAALWSKIEPRGGLDADLIALSLSAGEKQLLGLARAIVHHKHTSSKVALFDEIASQMDASTERQMLKVIAENFVDCTIMMIAHRGDMMTGMDAAMYIEKGRVARFELLSSTEKV